MGICGDGEFVKNLGYVAKIIDWPISTFFLGIIRGCQGRSRKCRVAVSMGTGQAPVCAKEKEVMDNLKLLSDFKVDI
jgi:hypothetical protein